MGLACLVASLIEGGGLGAVFRGGLRRLAAAGTLGDSFLWPAGVATVLALVGLRLFFEIRRSRLAVAALVLASCAGTSGCCARRLAGRKGLGQRTARFARGRPGRLRAGFDVLSALCPAHAGRSRLPRVFG